MLVAFLSSSWGRICLILAPFLFCFGLYATINPRGVVLWGQRWLLQGKSEPSNAALFLMRLVGIILLFLVCALAFFLIVGSFFYHYEY
jgi:hypothetical protein